MFALLVRAPRRAALSDPTVALAIVALALGPAACAESRPPASPSPSTELTVEFVTDGDTIRIRPGIAGSTSVRLVNLDAPEIGGTTQEPWAAEARSQLGRLLPSGTRVRVTTDVVPQDTFGRVLGHVERSDSALNVNREQLRLGQAVLFVIWPNARSFEDYRAAQIEAQRDGRGIWDVGRPLGELPYEYRRRADGRPPTRPAGDYFTKYFVDPADYRHVHVNNRVFFDSVTDALGAGYRACPRDSGGRYDGACFGSGQ